MSTQNLPLVSVITTAYNRGQFIRETIMSVLNQNYPNVEHIVVDGGSTDNTLAILQEYSYLGDRFRYVSEPDNGQSHAVNKGLAMARGEIIGWLNSDDSYLPEAIEKAVKALQNHPDWAMVHGRAYTIDENSHLKGPVEYTAPIHFEKLFNGCFVSHPTVFIRKNIFQQIGGADETLKFCLDYDVWIRISKQHAIGFLEDYLANYRVHSQCQTLLQWDTVGVPEILETSVKHYGTVSNSWLSFFVRQHRDKDTFWLLNQFKKYRVFGETPIVTRMNRYEDLFVPPIFNLTIESNPSSLAQKLLVKGRLTFPAKFQASVLVNGKHAGNYSTSGTTFIWEIPLDSGSEKHEIEFYSSHFFHRQYSPHTPKQAVSFLVDDIIPLSNQEAEFYHYHVAYPHMIQNWLETNRRPVLSM